MQLYGGVGTRQESPAPWVHWSACKWTNTVHKYPSGTICWSNLVCQTSLGEVIKVCHTYVSNIIWWLICWKLYPRKADMIILVLLFIAKLALKGRGNSNTGFIAKTAHYNDVAMSVMASQITSLTIVYSVFFIQAQINENIKAPRHWPLCEEFTVTGEFPAQRASNAENFSTWWCNHVS